MAAGLPDVGLPPDSGGMADIPQPLLGAISELMHRNKVILLLAEISELDPDLASDLIIGRRRDADAARFGNAL